MGGIRKERAAGRKKMMVFYASTKRTAKRKFCPINQSSQPKWSSGMMTIIIRSLRSEPIGRNTTERREASKKEAPEVIALSLHHSPVLMMMSLSLSPALWPSFSSRVLSWLLPIPYFIHSWIRTPPSPPILPFFIRFPCMRSPKEPRQSGSKKEERTEKRREGESHLGFPILLCSLLYSLNPRNAINIWGIFFSLLISFHDPIIPCILIINIFFCLHTSCSFWRRKIRLRGSPLYILFCYIFSHRLRHETSSLALLTGLNERKSKQLSFFLCGFLSFFVGGNHEDDHDYRNSRDEADDDDVIRELREKLAMSVLWNKKKIIKIIKRINGLMFIPTLLATI